MTTLTLPLLLDGADAIAGAGSARTGGKAAALARLSLLGFPVPELAALPVAAFHAFLEANSLTALWQQARPDADTAITPAAATDALQQAIATAPFPPVLRDRLAALAARWPSIAVRSSVSGEDSAAASFAGIHASLLHVSGTAALEQAVRACWASAWGEAALSYRRRLHLTAPVEPAVLLLPMLTAVSAGVAFSQDPRSGRHDHVRIAAAFGLGEAVVQGRCDPDDIIVELTVDGTLREGSDTRIVQWSRGRKELRFVAAAGGGTRTEPVPAAQAAAAALPEDAARDLARLARQVEDTLGAFETPQDIEWVWDGHRLWLVQARPITRIPEVMPAAVSSQPLLWSDANVREVAARPPSPMGWTLSRDLLQRALQAPARFSGGSLAAEIRRFRLFHGRMYLNLSQMQWESWHQFGTPPALFNSMIGGHQPAITVPAAGWRDRLRWLRALSRVNSALKRMRRTLPARITAVRAEVTRLTTASPGSLSDAQLLERADALCSLIAPDDAILTGLIFGGGGVLPIRLLLDRVRPGRGAELASALMAGHGGVTSAEHGTRLYALAAVVRSDADALRWICQLPDRRPDWRTLPDHSPFRAAFADFLATFGHRSIDEIDIASPRWREDPRWLLQVIAGHLTNGSGSGSTTPDTARQRQTAAWAEVPVWLRPLIRTLTRNAATDAAAREEAKSTLVFILDGVRRLMLDLGRSLTTRGEIDSPDDIFFCTRQEVWHHILRAPLPLRRRIAERRAHHATLPQQTPAVITGGIPLPPATPVVADDTTLTGMGVSGGVVRGTVRLLHHPTDGHRLQAGDILVAPATDPAWTPLFLRAGAVVAETGGWISHTAIVAREYGLPAVVNCPGLLHRLRDGETVEVDGNAGVIRLLR